MTRLMRLCADDFALDAACIDAILELLTARRLTATSCLVESPLWPQAAKAAHAEGIGDAAMGLHFNLTEGFSDKDQPLNKVLLNSLLGRLDADWLASRLNQQLDLFETYWGSVPAHVDGHQHVHLFPGIRGVVFDVLGKRYKNHLPRLRNITPLINPCDAFLKPYLLRFLGGRFQQQAQQLGFVTNPSFAGVYSFSDKVDYHRLFATWLHRIETGSEIMCHPARKGTSIHARAREKEYQWLKGDAFRQLLDVMDIEVA